MWDEDLVSIKTDPSRGRFVECASSSVVEGTVLLKDESPQLLFDAAEVSEAAICDGIDASSLRDHLCAPDAPAIVRRSERRAMKQLYTNAFVHVDPDSRREFVVLYWNISMMNHSCAPNASLETKVFTSDDDDTTAGRSGVCVRTCVVATRAIANGEEITIAYQLLLAPRRVRVAFFEDHYGFTCTCRRCCASNDEKESDRERQLLGCTSGEPSSSSAARRLDKLFSYALDPANRTTLGLSHRQREVLWQMLRLVCMEHDVWGVLERPSDGSNGFFWKAAVLRDSLITYWDDGQSAVEATNGTQDVSRLLSQLVQRQQCFLHWFFVEWLSQSCLAQIMSTISK